MKLHIFPCFTDLSTAVVLDISVEVLNRKIHVCVHVFASIYIQTHTYIWSLGEMSKL